MEAILVVNACSSSLKFQLFAVAGPDRLDRMIKGQLDGIGPRPRLRAQSADGTALVDRDYAGGRIPDLPTAIEETAGWLRETQSVELAAVGHRVVHGGAHYDGPVLIDAGILDRLERLVSLAPLHQPNNLAPIRTLLAKRPGLPQVACFDTAFHRGHGALADHYAIPERFYDDGVRRYGFHGLSYEYIADRLPTVAPDIARKKVIVAHLGSGASMCALQDGRSVDSTLGFTALDGLPMGTRPGQLDPGVVLYLFAEMRMNAKEVEDLLYRRSGLLGLSGISNDMRDLEASPDPRAAFAIEYFVYRAGLNTGMLAAALGGVDAFVFTAGIGENSASIRARITDRLTWLGARLDAAANQKGTTLISAPDSRIRIYVVPTDEELMIARHTLKLVGAST
jgi:acetate kinase